VNGFVSVTQGSRKSKFNLKRKNNIKLNWEKKQERRGTYGSPCTEILLACESAGHVTPCNCLSQYDVASLGYARSTYFGGLSTAQWLMVCCAVCGFPQSQSGELFRPPMEHVEIKASHSGPEVIQGNPFLPG